MRLTAFMHDGNVRFGSAEGDRIRDLTGRLGHATLASVLAADATREMARERGGSYTPLTDVTFLPALCGRRAVFCVGVNYAERNEEYDDGARRPTYPSLFFRMPESFTGHGAPLERPAASPQLDYEGEIALVIGRGGRHICTEDALAHVIGLTLANEGSVRDWLRHSKFNVTQGKNFDRSGSVGPWIVTADELNPASRLQLETRVNGDVRQSDTTDRLMFPFAKLISYFSTFATLKPGDVILTGTPTGAGARFKPPKWLVPGDIVEVTVPGVGTLRNGVVDEPVSGSPT